MPLTDTQIRNLKKPPAPKKYSDAGGLHLLVNPSGSKLWRMQYRYSGKQKLIAFGSYPAVSLADARKYRDDAKKHLAAGQDPSHQAKVKKRSRKTSTSMTFNIVADEFLTKVEKEGKSEATLSKKKWLLSLARGDIGERPISEITAAEILEPLRRVEGLGNYETARRLRSTIGQVFRYAVASAKAVNDPTGALRGALIAPNVTHRAAVTNLKDFGALLRAVWSYEGMPETKAALKLMALLFPRPGELRQAEWQEFDLAKAEWVIPPERAKMRREHRKPLPKQAVEILRELHKLTGDGRLTFPAVNSRLRPMSENTLNGALRRLGFTSEEMTSHGFRATASTLLNESSHWSSDAIEAELAHAGADQVRRAYHRALYWDERVRMAKWWADEIDALLIERVGVFA